MVRAGHVLKEDDEMWRYGRIAMQSRFCGFVKVKICLVP